MFRPGFIRIFALAVAAVFSGMFLAIIPQLTGTTATLTGNDLNSLEMAVRQAAIDYLGTEPATGLIISTIQSADGWAYGTVAVPAPENENKVPDSLVFLGKEQDENWNIAIEHTPAFQEMLPKVPEALISEGQRAYVSENAPIGTEMPSGNGEALLSLPWATGETWRLTGGPHSDPRPWDALDFAGGSGQIRAAREGVAYVPCANFIRINHADGWQTAYYHVANIAISNGQSVSRGQFLGNTSAQTGCGGSATGAHVHFSLRWNGNAQNVNGHDIGGWTAQDGGSQYNGCMQRVRDGVQVCKGGNIYNDGAIGSGNSQPPIIGCTNLREKNQLYWDQVYAGSADSATCEYWPFWFSATRDFILDVTRSGGNLEPGILLQTPDGQTLAQADGSGGHVVLNSSQPAGWYRAVVRTLSGTSGNYNIVIRKTGCANLVQRDTLFWNQAHTGNVGSGTCEFWPFMFSATRDFTLEVIRTSGDLEPTILLQTTSGQTIMDAESVNGYVTLSGAQAGGDYRALVSARQGSGSYTIVIRNSLTAYTISGATRDANNNAISGATITLDGNAVASSDGAGHYALQVLSTGRFTVAAVKSGYSFTPTSREAAVAGNVAGQDFTGTLLSTVFSISGRVLDANQNPVAGVAISAGAGLNATTAANGYYTIGGLGQGVYTIVPSKGAYAFSPSSHTVTLNGNVSGIDFSAARQPLILLPGIMGSTLNNTPQCPGRPSGQIWYTNLTSLDVLILQPDGHTPQNTCDQIAPGVVIASIPFVGDFYEHFLTEMRSDGYVVHEFAYDWRLNLETNALALDQFVNQVRGNGQVVLVGHSLGGMLARSYVADSNRAAKVNRVISVGTPYLGAPILVKSMRQGEGPIPIPFVFNDVIRNIVRNSPASMQILPGEKYFQIPFGNPYFMVNGAPLNSYQATYDFFASHGQNGALMQQARDLHRAWDNFSNMSTPFYLLYSNVQLTPYTINERDCWPWGTCWDVTREMLGDGTVPSNSASLSGLTLSANVHRCLYDRETQMEPHGGMMKDDRIIASIQGVLEGLPRSQWCPTGLPVGQVTGGRQPEDDEDPLDPNYVAFSITGNAQVHAQDIKGRRTGVLPDGSRINEIPQATFLSDGVNTYMSLPGWLTYTLTIVQTGPYPIQIESKQLVADLLDPEAGQVDTIQEVMFVDVSMPVSAVASAPLDLQDDLSNLNLSVDVDGDLVVDEVISPTSVLNPAQSEDKLPPMTVIHVDGTTDIPGTFTGIVTVTLEATDTLTGTGVLKTVYSLDQGETWTTYTGPVLVDASQSPDIWARSVDWAGNWEYPVQRRIAPHVVLLPVIHR